MKKKKLVYLFPIILLILFCSIFIVTSCTKNIITTNFKNSKQNKIVIHKKNNNFSKVSVLKSNDIKDIKTKILNIPSPNYYEEKGYKLNHKIIIIAKDETKQLELLDPNNKKVSTNVQYFAKTYYPETKVYSVKDELKDQFFKFTENGLIIGQKNNKEDPMAEIWAVHNGHCYRAVLKGIHDEYIDKRYEEKINKETDAIIERYELRKKSDVEKVIAVANYIADNISWQHTPTDQTLHSAVIDKVTVCTGYGKMFQHFMNKLGIPCRTVEGKSNILGDTYHVWNMVELDGEWYHIDTTYKDNDPDGDWYLFVGDDDFSKYPNHRDYYSYNKTGVKYKIYLYKKSNEYAETLSEVENIAEYKYHRISLTAQKTSGQLTIVTSKDLKEKDVENKVIEIFKKYQIEATLFIKKTYKSDYDIYTFNLEIPALNKEKVDLKIEKIEKINAKSDEIMDHIKITLNKKVELKKYNFKAIFSLIDKIETKDNQTYEIYLKNPENKGIYKEQIIINKQYYNFNIFENTKIELNVKTVDKPKAKIKVISKEKILITNVDKNTIYRVGGLLNSWQKATSNIIEINNPVTTTIELRKIDPILNLKSDIQKLELKIGADPILKIYNNEVVGVDESMEYKKEGDKYWSRITNKKLSNLKSGKYYIRVAATENTLPSNISNIIISN